MSTIREFVNEMLADESEAIAARRLRLITLHDDLTDRFAAASDPNDATYYDATAAVAYGDTLTEIKNKLALSGYGESLLNKLLEVLESANQSGSNQSQVAACYGEVLWTAFYLSGNDTDQFYRTAEATLAAQSTNKRRGPIAGALPVSANDDLDCASQKLTILDSIYQSPGGILANYDQLLTDMRRMLLAMRFRKDWTCDRSFVFIERCCNAYTDLLERLEAIYRVAVDDQKTVVAELQAALQAVDCSSEDWEIQIADLNAKLAECQANYLATEQAFRDWGSTYGNIKPECPCPGDVTPVPGQPGTIDVGGIVDQIQASQIGRIKLKGPEFVPDR